MKPDSKERYSRQVLFGPLGEPGQARLLASRVCIVGCGATGSALASLLARAGVGFLRIIDRDFVEPSNLQRQNLFDEKDAAESLPKAAAAAAQIPAIKMLSGSRETMRRTLLSADLWLNQRAEVAASSPLENCRTCARRDFVHLAGEGRPHITLCGRNSVQIHEHARPIDLAEMGRRL